jgi:Asp-tRNA(Asn)/Glu-tRNA(Gln) amidotransferase A subunit family amidase
MQIAGRPFEESTVLQVADAYETAAQWYTRKPQLDPIESQREK